jgi:UPF0176 protein
MQLYNTLSAEERAVMIDEAGKQRLTLSFYAYARIENPTQFRNELFLAWNPLEVLGEFMLRTKASTHSCRFRPTIFMSSRKRSSSTIS